MASEPETQTLFIFNAIERAMNTLMLLKLKMDEGDERGALQRYTWNLAEDRTWDGRIVRNCNDAIWQGCQMFGISRLYAVGVRLPTREREGLDLFMDYRSAVTLDRAFQAASEIIDDERKAASRQTDDTSFTYATYARNMWAEMALREESARESARTREIITKDENWQFSGMIHSAWWWRFSTKDGYEIRIKHHRVFREYNPAVTLDTDIVRQRFDRHRRRIGRHG